MRSHFALHRGYMTREAIDNRQASRDDGLRQPPVSWNRWSGVVPASVAYRVRCSGVSRLQKSRNFMARSFGQRVDAAIGVRRRLC